MDSSKVISFNQHVVLELPSGNLKIAELRPNNSISLGKFGAFYINDIIGYPLGSRFEINYEVKEGEEGFAEDSKEKKKPKHMQKKIPIGKAKLMIETPAINETSDDNEDRSDSIGTIADELEYENSLNNKNLNIKGNPSEIQELSMAEIEEMKKQYANTNSQDIINKIIQSHKEFNLKTKYSQLKYLNRKKSKFSKEFIVHKMTGRLLLNYLIDKGDIQRIMDMSEESIGMILNYGNVKSNGKYLVIDETGGLLVYFMMERMFGHVTENDMENKKFEGEIIVIHENEHVNLDLLKFSNYSEKFIKKHIKSISILDFFEPPTEEEINNGFTKLTREELSKLSNGERNVYQRRIKGYYKQCQIVELTKNDRKYDGLIVASTLQLTQLIPRLGPKIHGSRSIICYSQFKEILLELSHELYSDLNYLAPTLMETRCRPYQSVRGKLHPLMTMRGGGGYLMWSLKVEPAPPIPSIEIEPKEDISETKNEETEAETKKQKI
ncbi:hypothetical protein TBLA_0E03840 [Henningerozyma blattae CBS 6284]|uniref:tRNA (adenine(58)-N(1))-methyltransferase non-catalytic subunit TRM6 n=1 Tax=Henningerozyma blattae (strain ATCC 34711 / CBS 6284 / DSM 70876 / NBRC 10599 / NRRL Y-10934 / UCD 77-7) TaxID=1071380 RepID=I2H4Y6_HENB6|nr:hypothetical protein TBLA_0E03840 [Tetrapisispora blattae CBS 6284]CCH61438.1 hypothetical protein TBLA_0E03840 [Tetrapisispora blattae CBS 6284]